MWAEVIFSYRVFHPRVLDTYYVSLNSDCMSLLGCYNKISQTPLTYLFLTVLEAGESTIKVLANLVFDEGSLSVLQMAAFCVSSLGR